MGNGDSELDLSSACWEKTDQEERINELEKIGYHHVVCAKDYLQTKVEEVLLSYNQNNKTSQINVRDLIILDISTQDIYWVFYPRNFT